MGLLSKIDFYLCISPNVVRSHHGSKVSKLRPFVPSCILSMLGLVVIDSLGSFRVSPTRRSTVSWIQLSLEQYGLYAEVHVGSGLRFAQSSGRGRVSTYEYVVVQQTSCREYAWILLVSGGNDVYARGTTENIQAGIIRSMNAALKLAPQIRVVFGGSSSIWGYGDDWGYEYDRRIADVLKAVVCPTGASIITGVKELHLAASAIVARIGHVRYGIGAMKVIEALKTWTYGFEGPPRAKL